MEKIKVAINGFGRIGRLTLRELVKSENVEVVAVNDLTTVENLAYLLQYDSNHGRFPYKVSTRENEIVLEGKYSMKVFSEKNPVDLPWGTLGIDVVLDVTGVFRTRDQLSLHLQAGAKRVVLGAPAKSSDVKTIVQGVNDEIITPEDEIISNASCTTNCLAPVLKIILENFGIVSGEMTTVHAFTNDQRIVDGPHSDPRRGRSAFTSIIPTSTGAAKAVGIVIPELKGKLSGIAMRVPVPTGSVVDCTLILEKEVTVEALNNAIKEEAENGMKGILQYTEDPIVSADIISSDYSSIFDARMTSVSGNLIKFLAWYDNEYGYSARTAELIEHVGKLIPERVEA